MKSATLDEVQTIYYEIAKNSHDIKNTIEVFYLKLCEEYCKHVFLGNVGMDIYEVCRVMPMEILQWIYDVFGSDYLHVIMLSPKAEHTGTFLKKYVEEEKFENFNFSEMDMFRFFELLGKCSIQLNTKIKKTLQRFCKNTHMFVHEFGEEGELFNCHTSKRRFYRCMLSIYDDNFNNS